MWHQSITKETVIDNDCTYNQLERNKWRKTSSHISTFSWIDFNCIGIGELWFIKNFSKIDLTDIFVINQYLVTIANQKVNSLVLYCEFW